MIGVLLSEVQYDRTPNNDKRPKSALGSGGISFYLEHLIPSIDCVGSGKHALPNRNFGSSNCDYHRISRTAQLYGSRKALHPKRQCPMPRASCTPSSDQDWAKVKPAGQTTSRTIARGHVPSAIIELWQTMVTGRRPSCVQPI